MALSLKDYGRVLEIVAIAYPVHNRAPMFQAVCEKLEQLILNSSAVFIRMDLRTVHFQFKGHLLFRPPVKSVLLFCLYYAPIHPGVQSGFSTRNKQ